MKKRLFEILIKLIALLPVSFLLRIRKKNLIIPLYHVISDKRLPHAIHHIKYYGTKQFEKDLDFFQKYFNPISLFDLLNSINEGDDIPGNSFLLTFDDGFRECFDVIVPILRKRSIPAVFFLNSAFIDNKEMAYRDKASLLVDRIDLIRDNGIINKIALLLNIEKATLKKVKSAIMSVKYGQKILLDEVAKILNVDFNKYLEQKHPYLNSAQVRDMIKQGFMVGSHSIDHPLFSELTLDEQLNQVENSFRELNEQFNLSVNAFAFAFPFTDNGVGNEFFDKTHFNGIIDISFGTSGFDKGLYENNLQRQSMERWNVGAKTLYKRLFSAELLVNIGRGHF